MSKRVIFLFSCAFVMSLVIGAVMFSPLPWNSANYHNQVEEVNLKGL